MDTVGTQMAALKDAAGISLRDIARAGDWSGASSVQKYFEPNYDQPLRANVAARFARSLGEEVHRVSNTEGAAYSTGIGGKLKRCREEAGQTLREVGEAIGVHFTTIDKLERGIMRPDMLKMTALAKHFGVPLDGFEHAVVELSGIPQPSVVIVNGVRYLPE